MPRYLPEPERAQTSARLGVLLVNLGSPPAPTPGAVRRYLREFLSDPRVVELPALLWQPLLRGIILNVRPRQSARKYQSIWTAAGSPLTVHTAEMSRRLAQALDQRGFMAKRLEVAWAMRYGAPNIAETLGRLKREGITHFLILPLYPQYAASTTGSALDAVCQWFSRTRNQPAFRFLRDFHADSGYLEALAESVRQHWREHAPPEQGYCLLLSFHGLPQNCVAAGDPYPHACQETGRRLVERLGLAPERWRLTFQSRFGPQAWLQPGTAETLRALPAAGIVRVDVLCPGFVADCLETLEEIAILGKQEFLQAGGKAFHYIPALNERPLWIEALAEIVMAQGAGFCDFPGP
jgi:ferrochelatase